MVSVCLASYNGDKYIAEQIDSILLQLGREDELIISDDGSTDRTVSIIIDFAKKDSRIHFITNTGKHGCIRNFENALCSVKGDIVFLSDQDDVWLPDKYKEMIILLQKYILVCSDSVIVDENLNELKSSFFDYYNSEKGILKNVIKSTYFGSCMAFRKEILKYALPFPNTNEIGHDLWLGLISEIVGGKKGVFFYHKPLILYRRTEESFCSIFQVSKRSLLQKVRGRIIIIKHVLFFLFKYKIGIYNKDILKN
jgi:glycosyltransferase involved in cell wall biosynthesis